MVNAQSLHRDFLSQDHSTNLSFFELRYVVANGPHGKPDSTLRVRYIQKSPFNRLKSPKHILSHYTHLIAFITKKIRHQ